jgi:hypothetical protein
MDDRHPAEAQVTIAADIEVIAVTNFQILPDNGGFILILGARRLHIPESVFGETPVRQVEAFAAAFLSHGMLKNLAKVLTTALNHFEASYGVIPGATPSSSGPPKPKGH